MVFGSNSLVLEYPGEEGLLGHEDELPRVVLDEEYRHVARLRALAVHRRGTVVLKGRSGLPGYKHELV